MKRKLLLAASAFFLGFASFGQSQIANKSFENWESFTCTGTQYDLPTNFEQVLGPCYNNMMLGVYAYKAIGATANTSALKLTNEATGGTAVNTGVIRNAANGHFDTLISKPKSASITFKTELYGTDSASVGLYLINGDGRQVSFFANPTSQLVGTANLYLSAANNKSTFTTVEVMFQSTAADVNHIGVFIDNKANEDTSYISNANSVIYIDDITLNYDPSVIKTLDVTASTTSLAKETGSKTNINVTSTTSWTAKSDATWLTLSSTTGTGNATLVATATANVGAARTAIITLSSSGLTDKTVTITQEASPVVNTIDITASTTTLAKDAGSKTNLNITSTTSWTAKSDATWLTLSATTGTGNATLVATATANLGATRTTTLTLSATGLSDKKITITQATGTTTNLSEVNDDITVYPNPATNSFSVSNIENAEVSVYSLSNSLLLNKKISSNESINIDQIPSGTYIVKIITNNTSIERKLVK